MKKNEMTFKFTPDDKVRNLDAKDFIGKIATIKLQHTDDKKTSQYVSVQTTVFKQFNRFGMSGWVDKVLGKKDVQIKRKITSFVLLESMNGGRQDHHEYSSYWDYFNENKKQEVWKYWQGGLLGKMMRGGGDPDEADVKIGFSDFEVEDHCMFNLRAPEEWYSELYGKQDRFKFVNGFYKDANEAVHFFADKPQDDIFGTRYFPVIVFPKNTSADVREIAQYAKSYSQAIVTGKYIIYGTRCKPDEYMSIINMTYEAGGQVARAQAWDWQG